MTRRSSGGMGDAKLEDGRFGADDFFDVLAKVLSRNGRNHRSASRARTGHNCEPDDWLTSASFAVSAATSRNSCSAIHLNAAASVGNLRMDRRPLVAAMSTTKTANPSR